jgi:hypothetical protein
MSSEALAKEDGAALARLGEARDGLFPDMPSEASAKEEALAKGKGVTGVRSRLAAPFLFTPTSASYCGQDSRTRT